MTNPPFQSRQKLKPALASLVLGLLALGLSACASHPKTSGPAKPANAEADLNCADENAKPRVSCAINPAAAFDPIGQLWIAWSQHGKVYVSRSNDLGSSFSPAVAVNPVAESFDAEEGARPKIVPTKAGAVYVAWTKGQGQTGQVRFSRSLDKGRTFTAPVTLSYDPARLASLAVNNRDYVYLAWTSGGSLDVSAKNGGPHAGAELYYAYSSNGGRSFHPEQKISDQACACCQASIKVDVKQLPVLLWRQLGAGQTSAVVLNHFAAKDKPGLIQQIGEDQGKTEDCQGPALSIVPKYGYFVTWPSRDDAHKGLLFSSSEDQGKNFSPPKSLGQSAQTLEPDILADEHSIHLTWKQTDGAKSIAFAQDSLDGGQTWSTPRRLAEAEGDTDQPFLLDYQGHHYVAWQTDDQGFRLIPLGD